MGRLVAGEGARPNDKTKNPTKTKVTTMKKTYFKVLVTGVLGAVLSTTLAGCGDAGEVAEGDFANLEGEDVAETQEALLGAAVFTDWTSEEDSDGVTCAAGSVMAGAECNGSYCDNYRMICRSTGLNWGTSTWSSWFEHNGKTQHICPDDQWITGVKCWGDYCDNLSVRCTDINIVPANYPDANIKCHWSNWHSEEDTYANPNPYYPDRVPAGYGPEVLLKGMQCSGTHCDQKRYYYCDPNGL